MVPHPSHAHVTGDTANTTQRSPGTMMEKTIIKMQIHKPSSVSC